MSMQDPIADLLTRIRNGQSAGLSEVTVPSSKMKIAILKVLKAEGYIGDYAIDENSKKPSIKVSLKYHNEKPVIEYLQRVSKPGLRSYSSAKDMPEVMDRLGTAIVSTSQGVMTGREAKAKGQGGEILCFVA